MIKTYEKYTSSGIGWMKNIPIDWKLTKTKFVSRFRMGQTILKGELIDDGSFPVFSATEGDHYFGYIDNPNFYLNPGDIVIPARGNSIGHIKLVKEKCTTSQTTIANFIDQEKINSSFLFYIYKAFRRIFFHFDQTAIPQITVDQVKENIIPLPSTEEQTKIAEYLDHQTGLIDAIIEKKQQLIEKLKEQRQAIINKAVTKGLNPDAPMKDSGVEWLGEIPEHWRFIKLSYITDRIGDGLHSTPKYTDEESFYFINGNNLINGKIEIFDKTRTVNEDEFKRLWISIDSSTLLLSINGTIGNVALYNDEPVILGKSAAFINCSEDLNREFLRYLFLSSFYQNHFQHEVTGTTIYNLSLNSIRNCKICLPNMEEQINIIQFLNGALVKYDTAIDKTKLTIENLKSFRQSIVSEAVTGKIDVREWEPKLKETA